MSGLPLYLGSSRPAPSPPGKTVDDPSPWHRFHIPTLRLGTDSTLGGPLCSPDSHSFLLVSGPSPRHSPRNPRTSQGKGGWGPDAPRSPPPHPGLLPQPLTSGSGRPQMASSISDMGQTGGRGAFVLAQLILVIYGRMRQGRERSREHTIPLALIVSPCVRFVALVLTRICVCQHHVTVKVMEAILLCCFAVLWFTPGCVGASVHNTKQRWGWCSGVFLFTLQVFLVPHRRQKGFFYCPTGMASKPL